MRLTLRLLGACMFRSWLVSALPMASIGAISTLVQLPLARALSEAGLIFGVTFIYGALVAFPCGLVGGGVATALVRFKKRPWPWWNWSVAGSVTGAVIPAVSAVLLGARDNEALTVLCLAGLGFAVGGVVAASLSKGFEAAWLEARPIESGVFPSMRRGNAAPVAGSPRAGPASDR